MKEIDNNNHSFFVKSLRNKNIHRFVTKHYLIGINYYVFL